MFVELSSFMVIWQIISIILIISMYSQVLKAWTNRVTVILLTLKSYLLRSFSFLVINYKQFIVSNKCIINLPWCLQNSQVMWTHISITNIIPMQVTTIITSETLLWGVQLELHMSCMWDVRTWNHIVLMKCYLPSVMIPKAISKATLINTNTSKIPAYKIWAFCLNWRIAAL